MTRLYGLLHRLENTISNGISENDNRYFRLEGNSSVNDLKSDIRNILHATTDHYDNVKVAEQSDKNNL